MVTLEGSENLNKIKNTFIIDTNVILHDYNCLNNFGDNDIGIPITVLEEIDDFKKGRELLNFHAREFTRQIDEISGKENNKKSLFQKGISLGKNKGKIFIIVDVSFSKEFQKKFVGNKKDHHILAGAVNYISKNKEKSVIFVTKDMNLRIKARAIGLKAIDYEVGKIKNIKKLTSGVRTYDALDSKYIDTLLTTRSLSMELFKNIHADKIRSNQFFILRNKRKSILTRYNPFEDKIMLVENRDVFGIKSRNSEQAFAINALLDDKIKLVTITGTAGTGKTLLALAASLECRKQYKQIYLSRPIVPLSNKDIGYLPGTAKNKIEPYMQPLYDNLKFIQNNCGENSAEYDIIDELQKWEKLVISPLAYIRGRTLSNIFFIIDEAQNLSPHEVKTIITRAGEGTKIIFTGDINQIDTPYLDMESNGLSYLIDKLRGQELHSHITLRKGERSMLSELASRLL